MKKISFLFAVLALVCSATLPASAEQVLIISGDTSTATTVAGYLVLRGDTATIVGSTPTTAAGFAGYSGVWGFSGITGNAALTSWVAGGGCLFVELPGDPTLPDETQLTSVGIGGDAVHIVAPTDPGNAGLTDAGLSNWSNSFHDSYSSVGTFTTLTVDGNNPSNAVTVGEAFGAGHITYTGQDNAVHSTFGAGPFGAFSPKIDMVENALHCTNTPEPGSLTLLGLGLASFGALAWRKRK